MNIIIYNEWTIDPLKGGVERMSVILGNMLASYGHTIIFLCWKKTSDVSLSYPILYLPDKELKSAKNIDFIYRLIDKNNINVLINQDGLIPQNYIVCEIFKKKNIKIIDVFHNSLYGFYSRIGFLEKLCFDIHFLSNILDKTYIKKLILYLFKIKYGKYYRYIGNSNDRIVLLSKKYIHEFKNFCNPKNLDNIYTIPNPIPLPINRNNYTKSKTILFCGRMSSQKRPLKALLIWEKLYAQFTDWNFIMIGDGEYLNLLKRVVIHKNIKRISILGKQDPVSFYKKASILCMTSSYEGLPLVILEALNYGCVPIAYNTFASASDIITDRKDGILVKSDSIDAFALELKNLMKDDCMLEKLRANRTNKLEMYSIKNISVLWNNMLNNQFI